VYCWNQLSAAEIAGCAEDYKRERFLKMGGHATAYNGLWYTFKYQYLERDFSLGCVLGADKDNTTGLNALAFP
jgi:hypothetical protein